ncbi:hypothetical protein AB838_06990 [Rhodobacteraceae bacterium (ex Bugula neritina AB1)]|nr:hypothetical protein AB838_06990 [Rhodobacteraceae bacterium (ex Bugula neritina AB1)]
MEQARQRADLGFDLDDGGFNPSEWEVGTPAPKRLESGAARKVAEATGFRSREVQAAPAASRAGEATAPTPEPKPVRRRRTGRNAQFNLKARPDTIQSFCAVADAKGWGLGETLEYAVALLQREYGS